MSPIAAFQHMVNQLFGMGDARWQLSLYLEPKEIYPRTFPITHLTQLDLGLRDEVAFLAPRIFAHVGMTLTYLKLRLRMCLTTYI